ncbi:protein APEM9 [Tanacetum coccineum]
MSIWEQIELAESYLVCSMFEQATSSSSCVLKRLRDKESVDEVVDDTELNDMLESAGMVFVQSLKELGRTLDIITESTQLYGSLVAIPVQVFLAGVCFQMQVDPRGAQKTLEEFLSKWKFVNEQFYVLESQETDTSYIEGRDSRFVLEADTYLQVVEAYITLLTGILRDTNVAISWIEKAALPEDIRQEYLRRLQSMNSSKDTGSQASTSALLIDGNVTSSVSLKNGILEVGKQVDGDEAAKQAILRYSGQHVSTFWWFRKVNLKFGSVRFAVSNGSILLTALVLLAYYFMRRKKYTITSILKGQAQFVKKTVIDLWQLAFSYQVNPLAAVEPLQNPTRMSR